MRRTRSIVATLSIALGLIVLPGTAASAHEEKVVGRYNMAVGFGDEPAYAGVENSVQLFLHDAKTDKPIVDLGPTLKVQVMTGSKKMPPMVMEPDFEVGEFGMPGDYRAFFFPTRPGDYTFHFTGSIRGQKIDQTFASGPKTFSSITDPTSVEFPAQDPTTGELAQAITRLGPRVDAAASGQQRLAAALAQQRDRADSAKSLATVALVVGTVLGMAGLVVGAAGLRAARARQRPAT
jgi:hypothetical protein